MAPTPGFRRRQRRTGTALLACAVSAAALGLTGCGTSAGSSAEPTVTVWSWRAQDAPVWKTVQDDLAKQGTNVRIQFRAINATSYDSVLQTAMNGGSGPDIYYDRAGEGTEKYAAAGMAAPLDGSVDTSAIGKDALAAAQYRGKTYGVPFAVQSMELFYNKKLLADNGVQVPQTWTQLISAMKTLKSKGVTPMYVMGVQQWLLALQIDAIGASTLDDSTAQAITDKKATYSDPQFVRTLAAFQQLSPYLEKNWQATGSAGNEQETQFALGKTAFIIDGIFDTATIDQVNPSLQYGQILVPSPDGKQPRLDWYIDGDFSLNSHIRSSAESTAAEKVLGFTATKTFGDAFSQVAGEISPIQGVQVPAKYPLSVEAAHWYQTQAVKPVFGIRSPMDNPPVSPSDIKKKSAATTPGIFTAEQNIATPLLNGKLTPQQAAAKIDSQLSWYFGK
ncbi:ABC transporter substrate-binding protein [Phaeacidiphilus oryzae]|uniref:ABC transporter substrate-binding protein n=1 Tax=Phaeacidiphilus oryzae TaxID=348818 RepID=UPI0009FCCA6B|nr:extracellular solute-binding protein [Phaeacidiphilus oryzae]